MHTYRIEISGHAKDGTWMQSSGTDIYNAVDNLLAVRTDLKGKNITFEVYYHDGPDLASDFKLDGLWKGQFLGFAKED